MFSGYKRFLLNAIVHNSIIGYVKNRHSLFRIKWLSPESLETYRINREKLIIPVLNNSEEEPRLVLRAFSYFLYIHYKRGFKQISAIQNKALEMTLLRGMARSMGRKETEIFEKEYLPQIWEKSDIQFIYRQLTDLDDRGLLLHILLPELKELPLCSVDLTEEVTRLIQFLTNPSRRLFLSPHIRIGIYLKNGEAPTDESRICCDRFYLIDDLNRTDSVRRLSSAVSSEERIEFELNVRRHEVETGRSVNCRVVRQFTEAVILDCYGLKGVIYKEDYSWNLMDPPPDFEEDREYSLTVKEIDKKRGRLILSLREKFRDPRRMRGFPEVYTLVTVEVVRKFETFLLGKLNNRFEVLIPFTELHEIKSGRPENLIGFHLKVLIYRIDKNARIYGSEKKSVYREEVSEIPSAFI